MAYVLLTKHSVDNLWIHFESGKCFNSDENKSKLIPVFFPGADIPKKSPLFHIQFKRADNREELKYILNFGRKKLTKKEKKFQVKTLQKISESLTGTSDISHVGEEKIRNILVIDFRDDPRHHDWKKYTGDDIDGKFFTSVDKYSRSNIITLQGKRSLGYIFKQNRVDVSDDFLALKVRAISKQMLFYIRVDIQDVGERYIACSTGASKKEMNPYQEWVIPLSNVSDEKWHTIIIDLKQVVQEGWHNKYIMIKHFAFRAPIDIMWIKSSNTIDDLKLIAESPVLIR